GRLSATLIPRGASACRWAASGLPGSARFPDCGSIPASLTYRQSHPLVIFRPGARDVTRPGVEPLPWSTHGGLVLAAELVTGRADHLKARRLLLWREWRLAHSDGNGSQVAPTG